MNVLIAILFTLILSLSAFAGQAQASGANTSCTTVSTGPYTSRESCAKITIDKKVLKPGTKDYVDGLSAIDPKYKVNQSVSFQIVVQNVGDEDLNNITVVDTFPANVVYISGAGSYDNNSNKLTFTIDKLTTGQSQTFYIVAKVSNTMAFGDNGYVCVTNVVDASSNNGISAEDAAQFCVERELKVYPPAPVKKAPPTGPVDAALPILMSMGGAGIFLRRKVK